MATGNDLSVVIPSWREGPRLIESVRAVREALVDAEVVIAASDESASTAEAARGAGAAWIEAPRPCRGAQLAVGAERASGSVLLFLHADSRLPPGAGGAIREALARPGVAGGAFRLRFDRSHPALDALSAASALAWTPAYLGDQAMFCRRESYVAAGGFAPLPLFEDVDFARRLARVGRLVRLRPAVTTSARRFVQRGPWRQLAVNAALLAAFHAGVSAERLMRLYHAGAPGAPIDRRAEATGASAAGAGDA